MSRDKSKLLNVAVRRPGQQKVLPRPEDIDRLETAFEARGNGVAGQLPERPDVQAPGHANARSDMEGPEGSFEARGRGVVERVGRLRADGTRTGARKLRRMTVYLPPELARDLEVHALQSDDTVSDVIAAAVRTYLGRKG